MNRMIRINIDRQKYGLEPSDDPNDDFLIAKVLKLHKDKISIKAWDSVSKSMRHMTVDKWEVIE